MPIEERENFCSTRTEILNSRIFTGTYFNAITLRNVKFSYLLLSFYISIFIIQLIYVIIIYLVLFILIILIIIIIIISLPFFYSLSYNHLILILLMKYYLYSIIYF